MERCTNGRGMTFFAFGGQLNTIFQSLETYATLPTLNMGSPVLTQNQESDALWHLVKTVIGFIVACT